MPDIQIIKQVQVLEQIETCVSCGLCLTVCPTYKVSRNEAESPRGRLSIIQGLISDKITLDNSTYNHLDNCLMCGSCEIVCPAKVNYTSIMQNTKNWLKEKRYRSFYDIFFSWLIFKGWRIAILRKLIILYKFIGLQKIFPLQALKPYLKEIADIRWEKYNPVNEGVEDKGDVYLFKGCVASIFDQDTINSSIAMLNIAGFNVLFPDDQGCCGSLASHSGDVSRTENLMGINKKAFSLDIPIIVTSTGCIESVSKFSHSASRVYDIIEFLSIHLDIQSISPINQKILSHTPCSQRKITSSVVASAKILNLICSDLTEVSDLNGCCGSAGTYMYRNKKLSDKIVLPIIEEIEEAMPEFIITQNIGCRMQLMNHTGNTTAEVMHPVTLMYRNEYKQL